MFKVLGPQNYIQDYKNYILWILIKKAINNKDIWLQMVQTKWKKYWGFRVSYKYMMQI